MAEQTSEVPAADGTSGWRVGIGEIARVFLKIGAMSYGGPAIMGILQAEIQEKRKWIDKKAFVDGLAIVNLLPGPGATQLGIFIGHAKAGLMGGVVAGLCFILSAFLIMLALAIAYAAYGTLPSPRSAFYGIGPVVLGIFAVAVYRLGKNAIRARTQLALAIAAAARHVSALHRIRDDTTCRGLHRRSCFRLPPAWRDRAGSRRDGYRSGSND